MHAFIAVALDFIKKYWVWIVGIIATLLIVRKLKAGNRINTITNYETKGSTITPQLGLAYAERLYGAMAPAGTTMNVIDEIYNKLKQNPIDMRVVHNAFGVRPYGQFGEPLFSWFPSTNADLMQWFIWELSPSDLKKWKTLYAAAGMV